MKLRCNSCGTPVSTEVPDDTVVRAYIECPECVEKHSQEVDPEAEGYLINRNRSRS
jgi:DNA-directed RNA polymerase subunit RPC12/RpoP